MSFHINLPNRIANLPLSRSRPLVPLFEALTNSIQSVKDAKTKSGKIDIHIVRKPAVALIDDVAPREPITGFEIVDNGIGFVETNYVSFCTSDSPLKREIGGKGVGRLTWLKAFAFAEVESRFKDNGSVMIRRFTFRPTKDGIEDYSLTKSATDTIETVIRLQDYRKDFKCPMKADTIAFAIIEHFLQFFSLGTCPTISIHDASEPQPLVLNKLFQEEVKLEEKSVELKVGEDKMQIRHVRLSSKIAKRHTLQFCADNRPVTAEDAAKYIPNLHGILSTPADSGLEQFVYAGYVSGEYLDSRADQVRHSFDIPREDSIDGAMLSGIKETTWEEIVRTSAKKASKFLKPYTDPLREKKRERIREYVKTHPKYRPLFNHKPEWIDEIPFNTRDEDLDVALYKLNQRYDAELKEKGRKLDSKPVKADNLEAHVEKLSDFLKEWNEAGQAKLCEYVVHRRAVLDFLKDCLKKQEEGFALEDIIHETIFPMRSTSDDVAADSRNLWVIDERLCYHFFLASDKELRTVTPIKVGKDVERKRSDILVFHEFERFDNPVAIVPSDQPFDSVTVIEFKRPNRDDYTLTDNPIDQVEKYVRDILSGEAKDKTQQLIRVKPNTQFYAYIICTITNKLEEIAKLRGFKPMPDGQGFFKMHENFGLYEEVLDYRKVFKDAERRNQSFFQHLNIPER